MQPAPLSPMPAAGPSWVIRPSLKFIQVGYAFAFAIAMLVTVVAAYRLETRQAMIAAGASLVLLLWPAMKHIRRQSTRVTIEGDKLHYETGLLGRSSRIIQISKVQDVRVEQALAQRIWGVGDVSIETAGEASRLTLRNVDSPKQIAERLLDLAHQHGVEQLRRPY